jgi:CheY-like chemotaxis protein
MPKMSGYECATEILKLMRKNNVIDEEEVPRIYAVTGHVEAEFKQQAVESGMLSVYSKPININDLQLLLFERRFEFQMKPDVEAHLQSLVVPRAED